ncbi:MAG: hypothetical protein K2L89_08395, partial [Muribaculaceae bacterium]|nr:hypothetical protein [Muribaculaceae bacterium]
MNEDSLETTNKMIASVAGAKKIKDKELANRIAQYIESSINRIPDAMIFVFCNEKDVKKAKESDSPGYALETLKSKTIEKFLKKTSKGDFSSDFAIECLNYCNTQARGELVKLLSRNTELESYRVEEASTIKMVPSDLTVSSWYNEMPNDEVPTKVITEERLRRDEDDLSYQELMNKYYKDSDLYGLIPDPKFPTLVINGRFNGILDDRLAIFPVESSRIKGEYGEYYKKLKIVSENSTVPELLIECPKEVGADGVFLDAALNGAAAQLKKISDIWDINGKKIVQDGFMLIFPQEDSDGSVYTYLFDGHKWDNVSPLNLNYLSYEESKKLPVEIKDANYRYRIPDEYYFDTRNVDLNLLMISDSDLNIENRGDSEN